jgi:hypothetical protein
MMSAIEPFIKDTAPGGLYGEWAKKEDCWIKVKNNDFGFDLSIIMQDLIDKKNPPKRVIISDDETELQKRQEDLQKIKSIPTEIWKKIEEWGRETDTLSNNQQSIAWNLSLKVRNGSQILPHEIINGISIIEKVIDKAPELFFNIDELVEPKSKNNGKDPEITLELLKKIVQWYKKNKKLKDFEFIFMTELVEGKKSFTDHNKKIASWNLAKVKKYGFNEG